MEKKLRLQLFTPDGAMISDRLVLQGGEFYSGPKESHIGPIRIEFTLTEQRDVDEAKLYLDKLTGNLPLETKVKSKKPKSISDSDSREDFLNETIDKFSDNQDSLVKYLRENDFVYITTDFWKMTQDFNVDINKRHEDFQWLIHRLRKAKNPKNDRFDPMLAFGINIFDPSEKVVIYLNGKFLKSIKVPLSSNPKEVVKKSGLVKFPKYMVQEERDKFRIELRALQNDPEKEPSKFFNRWVQWVENLPEPFSVKVENNKEE